MSTGPVVVLARHAETEWSISGRHTGSTDLPLTADGRRKAELTGERLRGRTFARVLTSPLERARETCRIAGFGDVAVVSDDLHEWDYGEYEGVTTADIRKENPDWELFRDGAPGGESPDDVARRADRVVAALLEVNNGGGDAIVFSHGHMLCALGVRWIGLAVAQGRHVVLDTGTLSTLGWKREARVIRVWNDGSHLERRS